MRLVCALSRPLRQALLPASNQYIYIHFFKDSILVQFKVFIILHRGINRGDENSLTLVVHPHVLHLSSRFQLCGCLFLFSCPFLSLYYQVFSHCWTPKEVVCSPQATSHQITKCMWLFEPFCKLYCYLKAIIHIYTQLSINCHSCCYQCHHIQHIDYIADMLHQKNQCICLTIHLIIYFSSGY